MNFNPIDSKNNGAYSQHAMNRPNDDIIKIDNLKTNKEITQDRLLKEIDQTKLNNEQKAVFDVFTGKKDSVILQGKDLSDLYALESGSRNAGAIKIIVKHAGESKTGGLSNDELLNLMEVVRKGKIKDDSFKQFENRIRYAYELNGEINLRLVVDEYNDGKKIFDYYSDRNFIDYKKKESDRSARLSRHSDTSQTMATAKAGSVVDDEIIPQTTTKELSDDENLKEQLLYNIKNDYDLERFLSDREGILAKDARYGRNRISDAQIRSFNNGDGWEREFIPAGYEKNYKADFLTTQKDVAQIKKGTASLEQLQRLKDDLEASEYLGYDYKLFNPFDDEVTQNLAKAADEAIPKKGRDMPITQNNDEIIPQEIIKNIASNHDIALKLDPKADIINAVKDFSKPIKTPLFESKISLDKMLNHLSQKSDFDKRIEYLNLVKPTLENPLFITKENERYRFVKTFMDSKDKILKFLSVIENENGEFIGITATPIKNTDLKNLLKGDIVWGGDTLANLNAPQTAKGLVADESIIPQTATKELSDDENLKNWHKDSHEITKNKDGTPKVFYHGSSAKNITEFKDEFDKSGYGFWFADKEYAKNHSTGGFYEVYLNIKKPLDLREKNANYPFEIENEILKRGLGLEPYQKNTRQTKEFLKQ
ncbi:PBECR2 nuclease fold domain-containing protein, partial [Campylobacter gastrosuis]